ncbi:MAG TPA: thrombospondin type 3 repeat-containing protein [Solirubrobacteraceae bacterium]|jgi:hypothetical protein
MTGALRVRRLVLVLLAASVLALAAGVAPGGPLALAHPTSPTDPDHDGAGLGSSPQNPTGPDNCPDVFNPGQEDTDGDAQTSATPPTDTGGDACDTDDDADKIDDAVDNCRLIENATQADIDGDGEGDLCDDDDDADGTRDLRDNCIKVPNPDQADRDDDFVGDACDPDTPRTSSTAGGGSGAPAEDPARAGDRTAPTLKLKLRRTHRADELAAGLPVELTVSEACTVQAELVAGAKTARRLRVSRRVALGETEVGEGGRTYVFAAIAKSSLRRLAKARSTKLTVRVTATDAAGNQRTAARKVRVKGTR